MRKAKVYIALLHYPVYNKKMEIVTTSVTNLDLHDIARVARTYDVEKFFIVHPYDNQHGLLKEIVSYWQDGYGGTYNPDRKEAFTILAPINTLEEAKEEIALKTGKEVIVVSTDAKTHFNTVTYKRLKSEIYEEEQVFLILFGTGWGLQAELLEESDYILEPIEKDRSYNHLSVRSAVAIILDRLLGEYWFQGE
ncbi:MAG TPA: RNA methyltransferase [Syntrophomonadaceae bacterium]|nr:RNA methyltransferase [Syntrophomonadaceae bacterium]